MPPLFGDQIFVRTLSRTRIPDRFGNEWQYHPRSDVHSKVACWAITFDLLASCQLLAHHSRSLKVGFGINHQMHDFRMNRSKNLDLVVCAPGGDFESSSFSDLADRYGISLGPAEKRRALKARTLRQCPVGTVLVALEAKACMTEHLKARPRLYDELSSSYQTILGDTGSAIASAFVTINVAPSFISPLRNTRKLDGDPHVNEHDQPYAAKRVFEKIKELPRRSNEEESGCDAIGVVLVDVQNDGSPAVLLKDFGDRTAVDPTLTYRRMIERMSAIYATRFRSL